MCEIFKNATDGEEGHTAAELAAASMCAPFMCLCSKAAATVSGQPTVHCQVGKTF